MASTKPNRAYPALPGAGAGVALLEGLREAVEIHERRTGNKLDSFVRLGELVELRLALIQGEQILPPMLKEYANDTEAAQGGVPVGGQYRIGTAVHVRVV